MYARSARNIIETRNLLQTKMASLLQLCVPRSKINEQVKPPDTNTTIYLHIDWDTRLSTYND